MGSEGYWEPTAWASHIAREINVARAQAGLPEAVLDRALSEGCLAHCSFLLENPDFIAGGLKAHSEDPSLPGYTEAGERAAAKSDISYDAPAHAVNGWLATLYHRIPLLRPHMARLGVGALDYEALRGKAEAGALPQSTRAIVTADLLSGLDNARRPTDVSAVVVYPADGQVGVPQHFGSEVPSPLPVGHVAAGFPVTLTLVGAEAASRVVEVAVDSARLTRVDGKTGKEEPVNCFESWPGRPALEGFSQMSTLCLIPKEPLRGLATYRASVKLAVDGAAVERAWSFTTADDATAKSMMGPAALYKLRMQEYEKELQAHQAAVARHESVHRADQADQQAQYERLLATHAAQVADHAARYGEGAGGPAPPLAPPGYTPPPPPPPEGGGGGGGSAGPAAPSAREAQLLAYEEAKRKHAEDMEKYNARYGNHPSLPVQAPPPPAAAAPLPPEEEDPAAAAGGGAGGGAGGAPARSQREIEREEAEKAKEANDRRRAQLAEEAARAKAAAEARRKQLAEEKAKAKEEEMQAARKREEREAERRAWEEKKKQVEAERKQRAREAAAASGAKQADDLAALRRAAAERHKGQGGAASGSAGASGSASGSGSAGSGADELAVARRAAAARHKGQGGAAGGTAVAQERLGLGAGLSALAIVALVLGIFLALGRLVVPDGTEDDVLAGEV